MPSNKIFISYRRGLDDDSAGRVFDRMANVFGEDKLFRDVDSSHELVGLDFHDILGERVSDCSAFVAIIGPEWINGIERLKSENDFVRIEIEAALARSDIRVVPVLIGNLEMPKPEQLPESLQPLTRRGAIRLSNEGYSSAIEMLIGILAEATATEVTETAVIEAPRDDPIEVLDEGAEDRPETASRDDTSREVSEARTDAAPEEPTIAPAPVPEASHVARGVKVARALAALCLLGVMGFWSYAVADLFGKTERIQGHLGALSTAQPASLRRTAPALPASPYLSTTRDRIAETLSQDIDAGVVAVLTEGNTVTVRVSASDLFTSGSDEINPAYLGTFDSIATVMNSETGNVIVVGHTDNVPIRSSKFSSNVVLSLARARAVSERMAASFENPRRLSAEGWADEAPIASNDTREGRATNRRIEVILVGSGDRDAL